MPRPKGPKTRRIEFTLFKEGDPLLAELEAEAALRNVSLQQHIYDLLQARSNGRRSVSTAAMFWAGMEIAAEQQGAPAPDVPNAPSAASAAAAAWLNPEDDDDADRV